MTNTQQQQVYSDDYINTTAVFGEVKKDIFSKNFTGGSVTNIFGSTKLDFTRADINGRAVLDISQTFGEVKIRVPANWHIITEVSNFFAEVDDKRWFTGEPADQEKTLIIKGYSVFAAVDIVGLNIF